MTCSFTGLDPTKSYTFVVRSIGDSGGTNSDPSHAVTLDKPGKSSKPTVVLGEVPGTATVSWSQAETGGVVTSYTVTAIPAGGGDVGTQGANCGTPLDDSLTCLFTGLDPAKSYTFVVRSIGDSGGMDSDPSDAVTPDKPGKSSKPTVALGSTPGTATVSWNKPSTGGVVTSYTVTPVPAGGGTWARRATTVGRRWPTR